MSFGRRLELDSSLVFFAHRSVGVLFFLAALIFPGRGAFAASTPPWLVPLLPQKATFDYGKANAAILLDEGVLEVANNGTFTTRTRNVVRILNSEGKKACVAVIPYNSGSDRVKSVQAWLIQPSGEITTYAKSQWADAAVFSSDRELYGEGRKLILSATDEAKPGAVFAYEATVQNNAIDAQTIWFFQNELPVEKSSLTINLPEGWNARGRVFNHEPMAASENGRSRKWELSQLPSLVHEPFCPSFESVSPWLAVDILPPQTAKGIKRVSFTSWADITRHFSPIYEQASAASPEIKKKADELTASSGTSWERIRLLCRQAQKTTYISINLNAAEAGGYIPRSATEVLRCNYGDCKDKTTLLRALLRSQGIESYPLLVYSGNPDHVRPEWASPEQFNHCIVAIKIDDTVEPSSATLTHPTLGRLLIFDPTNEDVPPGLLPEEDIGGRGLILADSQDELVTLPINHPRNNRTERTITAVLKPDGSMEGTLSEKFSGLSAAEAHSEYVGKSPSDYRSTIERWLAASLSGVRATEVVARDNFDQAAFDLSLNFRAPTYAKSMHGVLLVFKPVVVARRSSIPVKKEKRKLPILVPPVFFSEKTQIELPAGFHIDESFPSIELKSDFGVYRATARLEGSNHVLFERSLEMNSAQIPAENYESVRSFFDKMFQAEQTPIVLSQSSPSP